MLAFLGGVCICSIILSKKSEKQPPGMYQWNSVKSRFILPTSTGERRISEPSTGSPSTEPSHVPIFISSNRLWRIGPPALSGEYLLMPLCRNGAWDGSKVFSTETSLKTSENSNADLVQVSKTQIPSFNVWSDKPHPVDYLWKNHTKEHNVKIIVPQKSPFVNYLLDLFFFRKDHCFSRKGLFHPTPSRSKGRLCRENDLSVAKLLGGRTLFGPRRFQASQKEGKRLPSINFQVRKC